MTARPRSAFAEDVLPALIRELIDEVRALRGEVDQIRDALLRPRRGLDQAETDALAIVREAAGATTFTAREIVEHSALAAQAELHSALAAAGVSAPRALGKLLRRAAGAGDLGGFRLERLGADRWGALWRFCEFREFPLPQFVTPCRMPDHRTHRLR